MAVLQVDKVHLFASENAREHRTESYEVVHEDTAAVLRRGQTFFLAIRFRGRGFRHPDDTLALVFIYDMKPAVGWGTKGIAQVTDRSIFVGDKKNWDARVKGQDADTLTLEVVSPVTAAVGAWQLSIETRRDGNRLTFHHPQAVYLLFNPWNKDDSVHMADSRLLDEYVLNDVGKVWVGPLGTARGREWVYGQFSAVILPAAMLLLDRTNLPAEARGDPVRLSRAISKLVNSNDDQGVLLGRWDGDYSDGTAPAAWTGSSAILEQYLTTGQEVKYGQCWVFAGVITTVCRALGIPSRVVSNLVSAHDANASLTVDRYYSEKNEELPYDPNNPDGGEDSVWNYHVWNDVWMARPDLPIGYGGWQAVDATPQETSDGVYQCGPASLVAIKQGAVGLRYDVPFLLASVNADLIRWKEDSGSVLGYTKIECNKYHIGRMILTKQPWIFDPNGDSDREDITNQYKSEEGSNPERLTLYNAAQGSVRAKRFYDVPDAVSDTELSFQLRDLDRINIGESFSVTVDIKNSSTQERTVQAALSAGSVFYNGVKANSIKKASGVFKIQPNTSEQMRLTVSADEYLDQLVEYCILKIYTIATVMETNQTWAGEDDFQVIKPTLNVEAGEMTVGLPAKLLFHFRNPLKKMLTQCKVAYEASGVVKGNAVNYRNVSPGEEMRMDYQFTPASAGVFKMVVTFTSKELTDITGSATLEVFE